MVNAKLHMICGNCGSDDMFKYRIDDDIDDSGETTIKIKRVSIICENCSTIHYLDNNAEKD